MAKEIARAEKDRILYDKLKAQSDRFLLGLNIRVDQGRVRGSVAQEDEGESSPCEHVSSEHCGSPRIQPIPPSSWNEFAKSNAGKRIIVLVTPCDFFQPDGSQAENSEASSLSVAREELKATTKPNSDLILAELSVPVCVCGRCENPGSKLTGSLRSVIFLLQKKPSLLVVRSGGLAGMWTQSDGPLASFISKHL